MTFMAIRRVIADNLSAYFVPDFLKNGRFGPIILKMDRFETIVGYDLIRLTFLNILIPYRVILCKKYQKQIEKLKIISPRSSSDNPTGRHHRKLWRHIFFKFIKIVIYS